MKINVRERFRGKGLEERLIEEIKKRTNGYPIIATLKGYNDNDENGESFYKKNGFIWSENNEFMIWEATN